MASIKSFDDIRNTFYINLEHRADRKEHVTTQLTTLGLSTFERFNAIKMEDGAIGCSMSHLKILQEAVKNNWDHVLIVEDDITFLDPELFKANLNTFFSRRKNEWDVILLAGNNVPPYDPIDEVCIKVKRCQTTTGYLVNGHYIKKLCENVKMGLTYLLQKPENRSLYAIDKFWFLLQGLDKWFLIVPATVVQREGYSDIEKRNTNFEKAMMDIDKAAFFTQRQLGRHKLNFFN